MKVGSWIAALAWVYNTVEIVWQLRIRPQYESGLMLVLDTLLTMVAEPEALVTLISEDAWAIMIAKRTPERTNQSV